MGQLLEKPNTDKQTAGGIGPEGIRYGFAAMQGWRIEMEDAHALNPDIGGDRYPGWSFFAIFDGHAGDRVSKHAAQHIWACIKEHLPPSVTNVAPASLSTILPSQTSINARSSEDVSVRSLSEALKRGIFDMDVQLRELPDVRDGLDKSGSTAVGCLITPQWIFLVNVGDSRALFVKDNQIALSTFDHKPSNDKERRRIIEAGGMVIIQRVNGSLAVSRALGDFEYKADPNRLPQNQLVSPEADVYVSERDTTRDQFLILACDGIWDVMSNEEMCQYVLAKLKLSRDLIGICSDILDTCLNKGSKDNMSVIIVSFPATASLSNLSSHSNVIRTETKTKEFAQSSKIGGNVSESSSSWEDHYACNSDNIDDNGNSSSNNLTKQLLLNVTSVNTNNHGATIQPLDEFTESTNSRIVTNESNNDDNSECDSNASDP
ncbi:hypothetical protein GJ496_004935 [Pomphorhynchus laevis]|nr:hypothetical protein GJ496_004935 [Pomphorhynchus laevis]